MKFLVRTIDKAIDKCVKAECVEYSSLVEVTYNYPYDKEKQTIKITKKDNGNRDDQQ